MLFSDNNSTETPEKNAQLRIFTSLAILAFGCCIAIWLVVSISELLNSPTPPQIVKAISTTVYTEAPPETGKSGAFVIPPQAYTVTGYLIVCFIYAIIAALSLGMIKAAVTLLQPETTKLLQQLVDKLQRK